MEDGRCTAQEGAGEKSSGIYLVIHSLPSPESAWGDFSEWSTLFKGMLPILQAYAKHPGLDVWSTCLPPWCGGVRRARPE